MLHLVIAGDELFDQETETFHSVNGGELDFEHSLISLSKWEAEFQKPFLDSKQKTVEELMSYIKAMVVTPNYDPALLDKLSVDDLKKINAYIESTQSATTFSDMQSGAGRGETVTSELIYYWMVAFNIPFSCETWHLNRLFALIRICNIKQSKPKKLSRNQIAQRNRELNAQRKAQLGTTG